MALEFELARRNFGRLANLAKGLDASPFSQVWQWLREHFFGLLRSAGKKKLKSLKNKTADPDRFFRTGGFKSSTARC